MPEYRICVRDEDRPRLQTGFHHPERLLDPPQIVVGFVYFCGRGAGFARDQEVVSGESQVFVDLLLVQAGGDFHPFPFDGFGFEVDVLHRIAELLPDRFLVRDFASEALDHPHDLPSLLGGELRAVGDDALFPDSEFRLSLVRGVDLAFVFEFVDAFLVAVFDVPGFVLDGGPSVGAVVIQEDPFPLGVAQVLPVDRLGEDVAVVGLHCRRIDVPGAVQPLVGDLDHPPGHAVPRLHVLDPAPQIGPLAFVSRIQFHVQGDHVGVQQQRLADDRAAPVFLGGPFPPVFVLLVDLEIVIGAIEVADAQAPPVSLAYVMVDDLDVFVEIAAYEVDPVQYLVVGVPLRPV